MYKCIIRTIDADIKSTSDDVEVLSSSAFDSNSDQPYAFHKDYYEFEMVMNVIEQHQDEGVGILFNNSSRVTMPSDTIQMGFWGGLIEGSFIGHEHPTCSHYIPYFTEHQVPEQTQLIFSTFKDKRKLIKDELFLSDIEADLHNRAIDFKYLELTPECCKRLINRYYELNRDGNQLTVFSKITWYPMASIFPILLKEVAK